MKKISPWHIWNSAVTMFWEEILSMSQCGPRPEFLCMDGVCIGISVDNIKNQNDSDLSIQTKKSWMPQNTYVWFQKMVRWGEVPG